MSRNVFSAFLYGRDETTRPRAVSRSRTLLIGRVLLATIFVLAGINKLVDWSGTVAYMESKSLPAVPLLLVLAAATEILGGLSLATGTFARAGALALFLFLIPTTLVFHDFWTLEGAQRQVQMLNFLKNLSIMGGLLVVIAVGAGRVSVDNRLQQ